MVHLIYSLQKLNKEGERFGSSYYYVMRSGSGSILIRYGIDSIGSDSNGSMYCIRYFGSSSV